jgi:hypothetical protein
MKTSIPQAVSNMEHFLAFRFCGKAPMIGYRENEIFHIIWLDPKFKAYNHGGS